MIIMVNGSRNKPPKNKAAGAELAERLTVLEAENAALKAEVELMKQANAFRGYAGEQEESSPVTVTPKRRGRRSNK